MNKVCKYTTGYFFPFTLPVKIPVHPHPGSYGVYRKYDRHTGVDLYTPDGLSNVDVIAIESGVVVSIVDFTGVNSIPPTPYWEDTKAVLVKGDTGVILYGEVEPLVNVGDEVEGGQRIAHTVRVLKEDKGRPVEMLHVELLPHDTLKEAPVWSKYINTNGHHPRELPLRHFDPTPILIQGLANLGKQYAIS